MKKGKKKDFFNYLMCSFSTKIISKMDANLILSANARGIIKTW